MVAFLSITRQCIDKSLWNGFFSPKRVDLSTAFQNISRSPSRANIDVDPQSQIQLISASKDFLPKKTQSFPALNFHQTISTSFQSPQSSLFLLSPPSRMQTAQGQPLSPKQTQSHFFATSRSTPFGHKNIKPNTSRHNFTLQLSHIDRSSTLPSSPKLRSLIPTPPAQESARLSTGLLTIRGLSRSETGNKTVTPRIKIQNSSRLDKRVKVKVVKNEPIEPVVATKLGNLSERKVNLAVNNEPQRSALFKLSDILETDPKVLASMRLKFNSNGTPV